MLVLSRDVTFSNHISRIIEHLISDLADIFESGSMYFMQFPTFLVQLAEKPPPRHDYPRGVLPQNERQLAGLQ